MWVRMLFIAAIFALGITAGAQTQVMRVVYDLTGTHFEIRNTFQGLGDGAYEIGPGALVVDYPVSNGLIVDGPVTLRNFTLIQQFVAANLGATVTADLFSEANFTGAQTSATGTLSNGVITWTQTIPYKVTGTNTCQGAFCSAAGFPQQGVPRDESGQSDVQFQPFRFVTGGPQQGRSFSGDEVLLQSDASADTYLILEGREVRRKLIDANAADPCLNFPTRGAHAGDSNCDATLGLGELVRVVQLFNAGIFRCDPSGTEDSYRTGAGDTSGCARHTSDYTAPAFQISLTELLRTIQWFNLGELSPCVSPATSEDGYCPPQ